VQILGIIPARYGSSRFPGKPLADILGKTMIQRVYEQCLKSTKLTKIVVVTDDQRIYDEVLKFGGNVWISKVIHDNGTSRCAEYVENCSDSRYDYIINIQGDEPLINPLQIDELANVLENENISIATLVKKENNLNLLNNTNIVKAMFDDNHYATDFVRIIQNSKFKIQNFYKHIGIYGFKSDLLSKIVHLAPSKNEIENRLEQLRWLDNNFKIKIGITNYESISVDTAEDLQNVISILKKSTN
jgi:3-deoxy-manno-octulosonate cytidylyltransferase (CMP-KDO synthetase)